MLNRHTHNRANNGIGAWLTRSFDTLPYVWYVVTLVAVTRRSMSEEQEKPKLKWYKVRYRVIVLIVLLCGIGAWLTVMSIGGCLWTPRSAVWKTAREQIQNAVINYSETHNQSLPTLNYAYTNANCSNCSVINISALVVTNGGALRTFPDGLNLSASGNDNCGGNASLGCKQEYSYIWLVNSDGDVYSYCAGNKCLANNSGYQDVWP